MMNNFNEQELNMKIKQLYAQFEIKKKQSDILLSDIEAILLECLSLEEYKLNNFNGQSTSE